jgi:hypothetical protein
MQEEEDAVSLSNIEIPRAVHTTDGRRFRENQAVAEPVDEAVLESVWPLRQHHATGRIFSSLRCIGPCCGAQAIRTTNKIRTSAQVHGIPSDVQIDASRSGPRAACMKERQLNLSLFERGKLSLPARTPATYTTNKVVLIPEL